MIQKHRKRIVELRIFVHIKNNPPTSKCIVLFQVKLHAWNNFSKTKDERWKKSVQNFLGNIVFISRRIKTIVLNSIPSLRTGFFTTFSRVKGEKWKAGSRNSTSVLPAISSSQLDHVNEFESLLRRDANKNGLSISVRSIMFFVRCV